MNRGGPQLDRKAFLPAYGALALPLAFAGLPMYVYAPDFYTTLHGVSLELMGIVLLAIRLVDAVQDPFIGVVSDRIYQRRFYIIALGLALLAVSFVLLYSPSPDVPAVGWFATCMVGCAFSFSVVSINYNALGSLWSDKPQDKTAIVGVREGMGLLGLLFATLAPALLRLHFPAATAFHIYTGLFVLVALAALPVFGWWYRRSAGSDPVSSRQAKETAFSFRLLFRRPFAPLFLLYGLSTLASSIPGVLVVFFIRDRLQAENLTGVFLGIYFIAGAAGMPLWKRLSARIGKLRAWTVAMFMGLVCFIGAYWLREGDVVSYGIICLFSGLALGAELILPLSLASDYIDLTGQQARTSAVFSVLLFMSKLSLALASGGAFLLLARSGYIPGVAATPQSAAALSFVYAVVPSCIKLVAVALSLLMKDQIPRKSPTYT